MGRRVLLLMLVVGAALGAVPALAAAATIVVTTTADTAADGDCTLREAIEAANEDREVEACAAGSEEETDLIEFAPTVEGEIALEGVALEPLEGQVEVKGPGAGKLEVDGGGQVRVFATAAGAEVTISGVQITGGSCEFGCGVLNAAGASLVLERVRVEENAADDEDGTFSLARGAGILNLGDLTVTLSTVAKNTALADFGSDSAEAVGGGIFNEGSQLTLDRSTVSENAAIANPSSGDIALAQGGGIATIEPSQLTIERSTIAANLAKAENGRAGNVAHGGGLASFAEDGNGVRTSTVTANEAVAADAAEGGGIYAYGPLTVDGSTLAGNGAAAGANLFGADSVQQVASTIVANPLGSGENCSGEILSAGFNLENGNSCNFTTATDLPPTDPMLDGAGLNNNGGSTETIALLANSPALDHGLDSFHEGSDQRGLTRPVVLAGIAEPPGGDGSDVGAFEYQVPTARITGSAIGGPVTSFWFETDEPEATFECGLDGGPLSPCTSPKSLVGLSAGPHTFAVVAVDREGLASATPTTQSFPVELPAPPVPPPLPPPEEAKPDQEPTSPPPAQSPPPTAKITNLLAQTYNRKLTIRFSSSDSAATFSCRLDGAQWRACRSPYKTQQLAFGKHTFRVRATNPAGATGPATAKTFTVLRRPSAGR